MSVAEDVSLADLLRQASAAALDGVYTSMPGVVQKYDAAKQTIDVLPAVRRWYVDSETGERVAEDLPVIPTVPVVFPAGGGYALTFPLAAGDPVTLVFSMVSAAEFLETGQITLPLDTRTHCANYPVALPGALPRPAALTDATDTMLHLGYRGADAQIEITHSEVHLGRGATETLALASKMVTELGKIATALGTCAPPPTTVYVAPLTPAAIGTTMVKAK